ncbi:hypothetical protein [Nocardia rhizosphaerae]|uniref:Tetracyclin repressor-like C-terminal domain-containing protein n=1 Tax=Nocardia rhizosphaerae TaxID=1691571 RepID=A0ABV8LB68_9NOCA
MASLDGTRLLDDYPPQIREPLFFMMLHMFSGEAVVRGVYQRPDLDASILTLVEDMLVSYAETLAARRTEQDGRAPNRARIAPCDHQ